MPLAKNVSPFLDAPQMKPFMVEEFIKTLETCGPQLTSGLKGDWAGLYRSVQCVQVTDLYFDYYSYNFVVDNLITC